MSRPVASSILLPICKTATEFLPLTSSDTFAITEITDEEITQRECRESEYRANRAKDAAYNKKHLCKCIELLLSKLTTD